jgi:hypothetical protein
METLEAHSEDEVTIGGHRTSVREGMHLLGERLEKLPKYVPETTRFPLGNYRGLGFGLILHPQYAPELYLEGATSLECKLSHHGARAILNALERLADCSEEACAFVRKDLAIAEAQLNAYQARLGASFPYDSYRSRLTALRDELKVRLSEKAPEPGEHSDLTISELAEQIKRLKASHTIEATPERAASRFAKAEEPVTSRIRRRTEVRAPELLIEPYSSPEAHHVEAEAGVNTPVGRCNFGAATSDLGDYCVETLHIAEHSCSE